MAHGGANWVITPLVLAILTLGLAGPLGRPWLVQLSLVPLFLFLFNWYFFRDPDRRPASGIVSPADGKVVRIDVIDDPELGPCDRISIFMSPLDVHVNRAPFDADVRSVVHRPGKHVPAFNKDSDRNERVTLHLHADFGEAKVVLIAGAVARRIVPYTRPGDHVHKGERIGLIRLGSRCDLIVPQGKVRWTVKLKDRVRAGSIQVAEVVA